MLGVRMNERDNEGLEDSKLPPPFIALAEADERLLVRLPMPTFSRFSSRALLPRVKELLPPPPPPPLAKPEPLNVRCG